MRPTTVSILSLALLVAGCVPGSAARFAQVQDRHLQGSAAPPAAAPKDCELRLYMEQRESRGAVNGIRKGALGAAVVERKGGQYVDGACLKHKGQRLELPASFLIASENGQDLERFCRDGTRQPGQTLDDGAGGGPSTVDVCTWNGRFHSARPFSLMFLTDPARAVGDYVEFVRVYRNGDLVAAWNRSSDQPTAHKLEIRGDSLTIAGPLAASLPPHLSAMDLRVIPRDASVTEAIDLRVRDDRQRFKTRVVNALQAGANEALPQDSPARASLKCLKERVLHAESQIRRLINGEVGEYQPDALCTLPLTTATGTTPLSDEYARFSNQGRDQLQQLKTNALSTLLNVGAELQAKIESAQAKALLDGEQALLARASAAVQSAVLARLGGGNQADQLKALQALLVSHAGLGLTDNDLQQLQSFYAQSQNLVHDVDAQVKAALAAVDESRLLAESLYDEARRVAATPERQAQIFNAVAQSLSHQGDVFEPRRDNPPLLAGEQQIGMEYADVFQVFAGAVWNAVPFRLNDRERVDFNETVAVPILDLVGMRWQWSKNRFSEFRLATGVGYTRTKEGDGSTSAEAALPNLSATFGTAKVGLGWAFSKNISDRDRWRLLVGADLFKLITGSNVEVF
jgi:hypothetical protein